ncbi:hypothetical protein Fmac_001521 [Flemingia macrophylla]|uniref:Uncharacterized protein n=1 Tax=Flemingia macrophylla TaxID=520843 RepID=A0ABD1NHV5_9FABA
MTTHLLIIYSLALCSLRTPPSPLFDDVSLLFEAALSIFISSMNTFLSNGNGVGWSLLPFFRLS